MNLVKYFFLGVVKPIIQIKTKRVIVYLLLIKINNRPKKTKILMISFFMRFYLNMYAISTAAIQGHSKSIYPSSHSFIIASLISASVGGGGVQSSSPPFLAVYEYVKPYVFSVYKL